MGLNAHFVSYAFKDCSSRYNEKSENALDKHTI